MSYTFETTIATSTFVGDGEEIDITIDVEYLPEQKYNHREEPPQGDEIIGMKCSPDIWNQLTSSQQSALEDYCYLNVKKEYIYSLEV